MGYVAAGLIAAGGSLAGSAFSGSKAAAASKRQVAFQKEMSRTAYQRAAKDLEKAGLNRVLALGNPASTPSGSVPQVPDYGDAVSRGMQAGSNISSAKSQRQLMATEDDLKQRQASYVDAQKDLVDGQAKLVDQQIRSATAQADKDEATKVLYDVAQPAVNAVKSMVPGLYSSGKDAAKGVIQKVQEKVGNAVNSAKKVVPFVPKDVNFYDGPPDVSDPSPDAPKRFRSNNY